MSFGSVGSFMSLSHLYSLVLLGSRGPQVHVIHLRLWSQSHPPINCDPPLFEETQAALNRLTWGKAAGICCTPALLLKAGGNAVLVSLHVVLRSAWNTDIIPTDWKRGLVVLL